MRERQLGVHASAEPRKRSPRKWLQHAIGAAITLACIAALVHQVRFDRLAAALAGFQWPWLIVGLVALAAGYALRIQRWTMLLRAGGATASFRACAAPFLGSIALNNLLPLRAGDVIRALIFPSAIGVGRVTSTAAIVLERVLDLLTLGLLLGVAIGLGRVPLPAWLETTIAVSALCGVVVLFIAVGYARRMAAALMEVAARLARKRWTLLAGVANVAADLTNDIAAMSNRRALLVACIASIAIWCCEAGVFFAVLRGLAVPTDIPGTLFAMVVPTLATLVPSSPGYVGPFHLAAFSAAQLLGADEGKAAAFALIAHFALWGATTVAGAWAIAFRPDLFRGWRGASDPVNDHSSRGRAE